MFILTLPVSLLLLFSKFFFNSNRIFFNTFHLRDSRIFNWFNEIMNKAKKCFSIRYLYESKLQNLFRSLFIISS